MTTTKGQAQTPRRTAAERLPTGLIISAYAACIAAGAVLNLVWGR